jgi:peptidoglycan-associated lipoprotein
MKRIISFLFSGVFILTALYLQSCSGGNRLGKSQKVYEVGEYHRAITSLNRTYRREKNRYYRGEISFYLGESYRKTNQPRRAAAAYGRAIRFGYPEPRTKLLQAFQLQKMGNHEDARVLFEEYLENHLGDRLAYNGLASSKLALDPPPVTRYKVEAVRRLNSRNSDFSPVIAPDDPTQIYFSSMRQTGKKRRHLNRITGQGSTVIYTSREDSRGEWQQPELLLEPDPAINWEDGSISLTSDGRDAYFTRCRYDNTGPMGAEIWNVKRIGGRWGEPIKVELGPDSLVFAHPAISPNGNTLYFVSDMPGGQGGKDIWKTERMGEQWGIPVNLGLDINTPGDEVFPFLREDGTFYFSSDGHVGYGGLDIFKAVKEDEDRWKVSNMGRPVNSISDDFGISFHKGREAGYFSSSRDNARGVDNIYSFVLPVIQAVVAGTIEMGNNEPIPYNTVLRVVGTDGSNMRINVEPSGVFNVLLEPGNEYVLLVAAPGYFNHRERIDARNVMESTQFDLAIRLNSAERPLVFENLQFEAGKYELTANALSELDKMVALMRDNPTVRLTVSAHTDTRGDMTELLVLSQQRAETVLAYFAEMGIPDERVSANGYGGTRPLVVDEALSRRHSFLRVGEVLNETTLQRLNRRDQEVARNLNHRVEFSIAQ